MAKRSKRRTRKVRNKGDPKKKRLTGFLPVSPENPLEKSRHNGKPRQVNRRGFKTELRRLFENLVLKITRTVSAHLIIAAGLGASAGLMWFSTRLNAILDSHVKIALSVILWFGAVWYVVDAITELADWPLKDKILELLDLLVNLFTLRK